jgi:hypothetical protein
VTPFLRAACAVAVRLPAYVSVVWHRPSLAPRFPQRVWRAFWTFHAIAGRR